MHRRWWIGGVGGGFWGGGGGGGVRGGGFGGGSCGRGGFGGGGVGGGGRGGGSGRGGGFGMEAAEEGDSGSGSGWWKIVVEEYEVRKDEDDKEGRGMPETRSVMAVLRRKCEQVSGGSFALSLLTPYNLPTDNPLLPVVSLVRGRRYSRGSPQMLDASLSPDKEPLLDCRTSDPKLLGAKCRILQSLPTRKPVDYGDRAPKAHTRFHPTSPMRTPIDYRRRPSVQAYPWRSLTTDTAFPVDMLQEGVLQ
ncbi:hypothetical protein AgCh_017809 [Apium graveolens]